jgi:hypothetical protein
MITEGRVYEIKRNTLEFPVYGIIFCVLLQITLRKEKSQEFLHVPKYKGKLIL